jgi:putative tryptophan/tyrosine transport system substrate-binding protein
LCQFEATASSLSVEPLALPVHDLTEVRTTLAALCHQPVSSILVLPDTFTVANYRQIDALARQQRLPACYPYRHFVADGGLMSYGPTVLRSIGKRRRMSTVFCEVPMLATCQSSNRMPSSW